MAILPWEVREELCGPEGSASITCEVIAAPHPRHYR
jgi:hypothetical protein